MCTFVRTFFLLYCIYRSYFIAPTDSYFIAPADSYFIMSTERFKNASRAAPFNMPF